jgi:NADPH-dependent 2,4-dienoyl-CoA reductase/sulfur reductase-like enzyme
VKTVAVVGASLAGLSSVRALRSQGFDGRLVVIGDEPHRPYDRPPLSKEFLAGKVTAPDIALEADDEDLQAEWLLGVRAERLDLAERSVLLGDGTRVQADGVVVATGANARVLPGTDGLTGIHTLRTLDDALALRAELEPGRRLVVIGAGFIGAEVASTARALGLDVTVVEAMETPLAGPLGAEMGDVVGSLHADHGVRLLCGVGVRRFTGASRVDGIELADGRRLPADLVLVGVGAHPNVEWLHGSGLGLGNGILCDSGGLTSVPGVVAVGDCAAWYDRRIGRHHRVEHWTGALDRPKRAVATLLSGDSSGRTLPRPTSGPTSTTRVHPVRGERGIRRRRHHRGRRPGRAQLPGPLPAGPGAGRRARDEPAAGLHQMAAGTQQHTGDSGLLNVATRRAHP